MRGPPPPPQVDGYVIGSCIRHIPLAGRNITAFVQQLLRDRKEPVPPEDSLEVAKAIKERHWCVLGPTGAAAALCSPAAAPATCARTRRRSLPSSTRTRAGSRRGRACMA